MDLHILRLGYQDRANLLPLLYPLASGWVAPESPWRLEVVHGTARALLDRLLDGSLDAAFVPPASLVQHGRRLASLGGWGVASESASGTALLLAAQRLDLMHEGQVAITGEAASSTAEHLLKTLLKPYYDIELALLQPADQGYDPKGARLLYADGAALEAQRKPKAWVAEDLGLAWWVFSGLPAVWEMLAVPRDLEERKPGAGDTIQALLRDSQRTAREQQATILDEASKRLGMKSSQVKELFGRHRYSLGQAEQKGLALFLNLAVRAKVLPR